MTGGLISETPTLEQLVDEAMTFEYEEIEARLGAISLVLDEGRYDHPSLYRLISVGEFGLPRVPEWPDLRKIGCRMLRKNLAILREILCSDHWVWDGARRMIEGAIDKGTGAVAFAIAAALAETGIVVTVAALVAGAIVGLLLAKVFALTCEGVTVYLAGLAPC